MVQQHDCIFCKIISGQIPAQSILETDFAIVIQDIAPKAPVHYLIIPKKHIQDLSVCSEQDSAILADLMLIPSRLATQLSDSKAFKLIVNNGYAAGQRVFHLHLHFMAGQSFHE